VAKDDKTDPKQIADKLLVVCKHVADGLNGKGTPKK